MTIKGGPDIHDFIVNPGNSSMVLGLGHHALYRPANAAFKAVTGGKTLWKGLDPEHWGAQVARMGEKADRSVGQVTGGTRKETLTLENDHLKRIKDTLTKWEGSGTEEHRQKAVHVRSRFDQLIKDHYHPNANLETVLNHSHAPNFKVTLHGVDLPSATGEWGKGLKNLGTDAAALYGSSEILNRVNRAAKGNSEDKTVNSQPTPQEVKAALEKVASAMEILSEAPLRDQALKKASELHHVGAIAEYEIDKYASLFFKNPDDAETISTSLLRSVDEGSKSARLGEAVEPRTIARTSGSSGQGRFSGFDAICMDGIR